MALAEATPAWTTGNPQLDRLRAYLIEWAACQKPISTARREHHESCLAQYMKSDSPTASSLLGGSDAWAMGIIDLAVTDLLKLPKGVEMHACLKVRYLNEGVSKAAGMHVRVFRSNRVQHLSLMEADALADEAEMALIPMLCKRNLPL